MTLTFGSLFAGIGGMDLGLERSGMQCSWQVEIDPYCQKVLQKHWPDVRRHDDVRTFPPIDGDGWNVDLIAGGFPCQDISYAGKGAGLNGDRSGLWFEFARIIRELEPRFVVVENVAALLTRGIDSVLGTLASLGYDAEWNVLAASDFGAPHIRERVFLLGWNANSEKLAKIASPSQGYSESGRACRYVADSDSTGCEESHPAAITGEPGFSDREIDSGSWNPPNANSAWQLQPQGVITKCGGRSGNGRGREVEPAVCRMADGIPNRVDRIKGLGNAVVPQVAEWIGNRIIECFDTP